MVRGQKPVEPEEPLPDVAPGATMVYKPKQPVTEAVSPEELGLEREIAFLTLDGERHELEKQRVVIGRSRDCDVQLADPNVSRRHAELRQEGSAYWVVDLDSTNGMEVNGRRLKRAKLKPGDTITIGSTDLVFGRETE
jgi:pSer/pThr/pTyr-binding forkhead associated (FHA) protein